MIKYISLLFLILISCTPKEDRSSFIRTDICIYGGSEASFTAAIQAAGQGRSVAFISPYGHVGGFIIEGLSRSDVGDGHVNNKQFVSGTLYLILYGNWNTRIFLILHYLKGL